VSVQGSEWSLPNRELTEEIGSVLLKDHDILAHVWDRILECGEYHLLSPPQGSYVRTATKPRTQSGDIAESCRVQSTT
jgi:hypothetical protein